MKHYQQCSNCWGMRGITTAKMLYKLLSNSPVLDSQATGMAERAVQTVEGQVRTMVLAMEAKLDQQLDANDDVLP